MYGIIYKITCCENNKVYIGLTTKSLEWRFKKHIYEAFKYIDSQLHLRKAIRRYGADAFKIEQIDAADTSQELIDKEKYWISYYNSTAPDFGYNETVGGEGGNTYSCLSEERMTAVRAKISRALSGRNNGNSNQIKCKSVVTGEEHYFDTLTECLNFLGVKNKETIMKRVRGECNLLWHDEWLFAWEDSDYISCTVYDKSCNHGTKVKLVKDNSDIVFNSITKAAQFLKVPRAAIIDDSIICNYKIQILS